VGHLAGELSMKKTKVAILGAKGMLGKYVERYFRQQQYYVTALDRTHIDASLPYNPDLSYFLDSIDLIINCAGVIKPRIESVGTRDTLLINSVFPHSLSEYCEKKDKKLVHITTDCVFNGRQGKYKENDFHDAEDLYGRSKSLGEPENCTVIRTSIIGEEVNQKRSLVEWVKSQKGKDCNGFSTHWWNGVTCLQFAKIVEEILEKDMFWQGVRHIHSPVDVNKFYLLECINRSYDLGITVHELDAPPCDRTLRSDFDTTTELSIPEIPVQIQEMKEFSLV
jgi:dTDP-4-dehydrorhamnose reductase